LTCIGTVAGGLLAQEGRRTYIRGGRKRGTKVENKRLGGPKVARARVFTLGCRLLSEEENCRLR